MFLTFCVFFIQIGNTFDGWACMKATERQEMRDTKKLEHHLRLFFLTIKSRSLWLDSDLSAAIQH
jgi:hypothetical protein